MIVCLLSERGTLPTGGRFVRGEGKIMAAEDSNRGFTLVELIVALVVLSVLLAIAVPSLMGHIERAREERFVLEAQDVRRATERYLIEQYPKGEVNLMELLNAANSSEICPKGGRVEQVTVDSEKCRVMEMIYRVKGYRIELKEGTPTVTKTSRR